jgi:hypothetical protein
MTELGQDQNTDDCGSCAALGRRDFLLDALRAGAVALAMIGIAPAADAMPLRWISALSARGQEKSYNVPSADGVQIDKENEVIISRMGKQVFAFALSFSVQSTIPSIVPTEPSSRGGQRAEWIVSP